MRSALLLLPILAFLALTIGAEEKKKKLQIGIKKRIDPSECKMKSRKNDVLSMHYTVRLFLCKS